jgi:DNA-binding transcriptional ArsR family regulator
MGEPVSEDAITSKEDYQPPIGPSPHHPVPIPDAAEIRLMDVLRALADPIRMHIFLVLADGEYHGCSADAFNLHMKKSTLSHHFKTLREAGVTQTRVEGRNYDIRLRRDDLESRFPGVIASLLTSDAVADLSQPG